MTQTQIEQTRVIAEWVEQQILISKEWAVCAKNIIQKSQTNTTYLTSLDWLHPVAIDVLSKLHEDNSFKKLNIEATIECSCVKPPINGEYIDLFNAVYEGIVYLQNQEK